ncbi:MAG TPA: glycosyltransferase N-terminal domain-containing protein [Longimicrobiales bacterium]|nr:glycosyltransferase N-terminal domain-containing protein [Longimicrobiales bacterium]
MNGSQRPAMMPPEPAGTSASDEAEASEASPSQPPVHVIAAPRTPAPARPSVSAEEGSEDSSSALAGDEASRPSRPDNRDPGPDLRPREHLYRAALGLARPFVQKGGGGDEKLQKGLAGRRLAVGILEAWAAEHRDPDVPLVWMHAPSAGESLMAKAIIAELRRERPDVQVAFTHFSPSAERLLDEIDADVAAYLPWDVRRDVRRSLDALAPSVIAYVRSEVWPVLGAEAKRRGVRVALVNAALSSDSSRLKPAARWLLGPAYARLDLVGAVAPEDAELHARLGALASRTRVTGDARIDQVLERLEGELPEAARRLDDPDRVTLVAGSTWPSDEVHLLPAFFRAGTGARLVIAPHEPTEEHLVGIEDRLNARYVTNRRLSDVVRDRHALPTAVVVDQLGVLADLYRIADLAYVGGGFTDDGVHSVLEPAAVGIPVLLGPRHGNAREAAALVAAGGGVEVTNAAQLEGRLRTLTQYETAREAAGGRAREFVRARTGGAAANAAAILALIDG